MFKICDNQKKIFNTLKVETVQLYHVGKADKNFKLCVRLQADGLNREDSVLNKIKHGSVTSLTLNKKKGFYNGLKITLLNYTFNHTCVPLPCFATDSQNFLSH